MDQALNKFLKKQCVTQAGVLVGRLCKQIEVMIDQKTTSKETKEALALLKDLQKESIYQEFRDLREAVIFYTEGREHIKIPIYDPNKKDK